MCDERERLIGYVYGECDAEERRTIDRHLEECHTCRDEISGLREVRHDLLAWEVPEHGSVWEPFAPARVAPWWRVVPAWAMAAAAGVMFVFGAAGSAVMHAVLDPARGASPARAAAASASPGLTTINPGVTPADLEALERRVVMTMRGDLEGINQRLRLASTHGGGPAVVRIGDTSEPAITGQLREMNALQAEQLERYFDLFNRVNDLTKKANDLDKNYRGQNALLQSIQSLMTQQIAPQSGGSGGR